MDTPQVSTLDTETIPCPVCGGKEFDVMYRPWRSVNDPVSLYGTASGERGTQQIVRCRAADCRMIYVNPRHTEAIILKGYTNADDHGHDTQYNSRVETFFRSLKKHARYLPPAGARVLDIGCAGGAFVSAAKAYGYRVTGLEPSSKLVESARARGLDIVQGVLEKYEPGEKFDLITLWDVLEHVTQPRDVLKLCHALLKPDGVLMINYPDIGTPMARASGKNFWWILSVHLHHFDRHSMGEILSKEKFKVLSWRRHVQILEFGYLLDVARIYSPKLAAVASALIPKALKRLHVPYYASQTTVLARKSA